MEEKVTELEAAILALQKESDEATAFLLSEHEKEKRALVQERDGLRRERDELQRERDEALARAERMAAELDARDCRSTEPPPALSAQPAQGSPGAYSVQLHRPRAGRRSSARLG